MAIAHSLRQRALLGERMDDPGLPDSEHRAALSGLRRLNAWSGAGVGASRVIVDLLRRAGVQRPHVIDVAAGGGDVTRRIGRRLIAAGLEPRVDACDASDRAVAWLEREWRRDALDGTCFVHDARTPLPGCDVVVSTLFMHHLENEEAEIVLTRMLDAARVGVVIEDLDRSAFGYVLAYGATRVLSRSPVVHADGPRSVRAAFTRQEIASLAERCGGQAKTRRCWPARWVAVLNRTMQ